MASGQARWRPWAITGLLFFLMFINFADRAVIGLAAVPMMEEMHLSPIQWGTVGSSFYYLLAISTIAVGFIADRVPTKWVLAILASVWALTQFPMVGTVSLPMLVACRIALGAGEGPAFPVAVHAAYKWFPSGRRTLPTGLIVIGASIGVTVATPILVHVIYAYSWHAAFGLLGVVGAVWVVAWLIFGAEGLITEATIAGGPSADDRVPYLRLFTCPTVLGILIAGWVASWGLSMLIVWVPAFIQKGLGYSVEQTTWLLTTTWLATAFLAPSFGWLSQRWEARGASSRRARGIPAALLVSASGSLAILGLLAERGPLQIGLFTIAYAIGGLIFTLGPALLDDITPQKQRGAVLAIVTAIYSIAGIVAPAVAGHLIAAGPTPAQGYFHAFMLSASLTTAGGLVALLLIRPEADRARLAAERRARPMLARST